MSNKFPDGGQLIQRHLWRLSSAPRVLHLLFCLVSSFIFSSLSSCLSSSLSSFIFSSLSFSFFFLRLLSKSPCVVVVCCCVLLVLLVLCGLVCCVSFVLCLFVLWCETLQNRVWIQKRLRVYIQNVPVCAGTTRTHALTCARGCRHTRRRLGRTHGDVLDGHTGVLNGRQSTTTTHTTTTTNKTKNHQKIPHVGLTRASEVHQSKHWILHIFSLRVGREQHVHRSLYLRETS